MAKTVDFINQNLGSGNQEAVLNSKKYSDLRYTAIVVCWAAMLIFTFHACTHMVAAGDTWVAMACGRHFVNHGVDTVEPFSANSHKAGPTEEEIKTWPNWAQWITEKVGIETVKKWHPTGWINQNWLTHVIFYSLVPKSSYADGVSFSSNALVYWKFFIYILAVICVYYTGRLLGVHPWLCTVFSCFAMFTGRSFIDIRPAGFSNMLVAVFMLVLALTTYRNALYIWLIVPLTVFWCNVHGGYIYAFIMLMPFIFWHILMILPQKKWMHSVYSILAWVVLYAFSYKFLNHEHLVPISPGSDWAFFVLILCVGICITITIKKQISDQKIYVYNISATVVLFLLLLPRFFPAVPTTGINYYQENLLEEYIASSQLAYFGISVFIILLSIFLTFLREKVSLNLNFKGICHVVAAGFVAFVAMVLFNPFHFTNLTHTFIISVSKHAARWRNIHEWHPAFNWSNPVGTAVPFLIMYIIGWVAFGAWIIVMINSSRTVNQQNRRKTKVSDGYQWQKVDISLLLIAAMTIYMAIRSRRFIPIAAIAACPIIAMLIDQVVRRISALINFSRNRHLTVGEMGYNLQLFFVLAGAMTTMYFGTWWGLKFKRIYLDSWPRDPKLNSMFMRMTDSGQKPFYACKYIKDNKLKGNMFNAWTEGGFIAFGQEPDPVTGKTPLKLFMDGRAQAAYDRSAFDLWTEIMGGGQVTRDIIQRRGYRNQRLTNDDYVEIGKWMDEQMRRHNVWVVLMPQSKYSLPPDSEYYQTSSYHAIQGLERNIDWRLVFFNNKQRLYVDIKTPQGKALFEGVFNGKTIYPDEFHRNLIRAHGWLIYGNGISDRKKGFDFAVRAFELQQSPAPMLEIILVASSIKELRPEINKFCEDYLKQFEENRAQWVKEDGFRDRVEAGRLAGFYLGNIAKINNDTKLLSFYVEQQNIFVGELIRLARIKRW